MIEPIFVLKIAACLAAGYIIGCFSPSYLLGKLKSGKDIREHGSGNAGATNTIRTFGMKWGVVVFCLDLLKGVCAFLLGRLLGGGYAFGILCGVAAVLGHDFPIFLGFRGGKGISTSLGILLGIHPVLGMCVVLSGIILSAITRKISVISLCGLIVSPILLAVFDTGNLYGLIALVFLSALGVFTHRANILRLIKGEEKQLTISSNKTSDDL